MNDGSKLNENLSPLKQAFLVLEKTRARLDSLEYALREPIAVVGAGCRLPGGANSPEAFWELLASGRDAITEVPPNRWNAKAFYDPAPDALGKMVSLCGGFVDEVERFDAHFFGISPREAMTLDPQQRLLLETAFEALEDAAMAPDRLAKSCGGVFVGICGIDYSKRITRRDPDLIDAYIGTGNSHSVAAGRLSYYFGLQGPSVAIDTACSSSLVALHWACQSLRAGECDFALTGGVNLLLDPELSINFSKAHMLSPSGRCRTFDASADGYVRGEGAVMFVLKRLRDARADGDRILALIRSSAVNQDGPSSGLTVPNGPAQQEVIRRALAAAEIPPGEIDYLEAHGTGTSLGDPIEMIAMGEVFRERHAPLCVGSVKTNIGHLEATAGVAGALKVILAFQHAEIPPHLHLREPSPRIPWEQLPVRVATRLEPWPRGDHPRRAGVSAFAFNGTNAHVVLEEAPEPEEDAGPERPCHLLPLSAKTSEALRDLAGRYVSYLVSEPAASWSDVCHTAGLGRAHFAHRLAVRAETMSEAKERLQAFADGRSCPEVASAEAESESPSVALLFSGQGAQYAGMGLELRRSEPTFRAAIRQCEEILRDELDRTLEEIFDPQSGAAIDRTIYAQPALFALEYSLAKMWQHWGVSPTVMIGHSVGEYVAACLADVFSLEDGLRLISARARLMQNLPGGGLMAAVRADEDRVRKELAGLEEQVDVAAVNGPHQVVVSGVAAAIEQIVARLEREGIAATRLRVSHAFHSPLMNPMLEDFRNVAATVAFARPRIKLISNLTGGLVDEAIARPEYWVEHVRRTVRFSDGVAALGREGIDVALEIGPQATLLGLARACWPTGSDRSGPRWLASLRRGKPDWQSVLDTLAELYVAGQSVDWAALARGFRGRKTAIPTYPFQRRRYWLAPTETGTPGRSVAPAAVVHPLLGHRLHMAAVRDTVLFEGRIRSDEPAYLKDHRVMEMVVFPGTGFLEMAVAAGRQLYPDGPVVVDDVTFERAITLPDNQPNVVQVVMMPDGPGHRCELFCRPESPTDHEVPPQWTCHARGRVVAGDDDRTSLELETLKRVCVEEVAVDGLYEQLGREALHYGPCFRGLKQMFRSRRESLSRVELPEGHRGEAQRYQLHPALLDACLHGMAGIVSDDEITGEELPPFLPVGLKRLRLFAPAGSEVWSYARIHGEVEFRQAATFIADLHLFRPDGRPIAVLEELRMQRVARAALSALNEPRLDDWLYELSWQESDHPAGDDILANVGHVSDSGLSAADQEPSASQHVSPDERRNPDVAAWILLADGDGLAEEVARRLGASGSPCVLVRPGERYRVIDAGADVPVRCEIRHDCVEDFTRLFQEILVAAGRTRTAASSTLGVVHLWGLGLSENASDAFQSAHRFACGSALCLVQAAASGNTAMRLWLLTRGAQVVGDSVPNGPSLAQAPLWGLARVIAIEHSEMQCRRVDLDPFADHDSQAASLVAELSHPDGEDQVAYRGGTRYIARLERAGGAEKPGFAIPNPPYRLQLTALGTLDGLRGVPCPRRRPGPGEVEIAVSHAGINFRDLLRSLGMLENFEKVIGERLGISSVLDAPLGFECAGAVTAVGEGVEHLSEGDEVMAIAYGSFASHVTAPAGCVVRKPGSLSMAEAATVPMAFVTASYALEQMANLQPGERVLIHAASGGVGQAAVQIARAIGAEVFATASPGKWEALRSQSVRHVFNSRNLDFHDEVMRATGGQGVDVVLNSLNGEFIPASLATLRPGGRFVEIGLLGVWDAPRVAAEYPTAVYHTLDIDREEALHPGSTRLVLERLTARLEAGELTPLPHRVFPLHRITEALRYLNHAHRIGKIVVAVGSEGLSDSRAAVEIGGDATYLITGGLGGLGLQVARWLVEQGAGHVVLTSRHGPATSDQAAALERLRQAGGDVRVIPADVSRREDVERLLTAIRSELPPLAGVFHAAGALDDGMLRLQNWDRFSRVMRPKVAGAWHLHELAGDLDLFVLFSSGVALVGGHGQGNYAAANAFLDVLAQYRRAAGLPAVSIAWGPWTDVGMMARTDDRARARMAQVGVQTIDTADGLRMLAKVIQGERAHVAPLRIDWRQMASAIPPTPFWARLARAPARAEPQASAFLDQLRAAPAGERAEMLVGYLRTEVASVLGWDSAGQVGQREKLFDLGMDSLTSVELRHRLEKNLACSLPLTVVFDYPTIEVLAQYVAARIAPDRRRTSVYRTGGDRHRRRRRASDVDVGRKIELRLADRLKDLLDE